MFPSQKKWGPGGTAAGNHAPEVAGRSTTHGELSRSRKACPAAAPAPPLGGFLTGPPLDKHSPRQDEPGTGECFDAGAGQKSTMNHALLRFKKKVGAWRHGGGASGPATAAGQEEPFAPRAAPPSKAPCPLTQGRAWCSELQPQSQPSPGGRPAVHEDTCHHLHDSLRTTSWFLGHAWFRDWCAPAAGKGGTAATAHGMM